MPHFTVSHLLGFFNLLRIQLDLSWINSTWATMRSIRIVFMRWLHITIIIIILRRWLSLAASGLSILLGNSGFELVNGDLFKLFPCYLLFSEPCILGLTIFVDIDTMGLLGWSLRMVFTTFCISLIFSVWTCHIEHNVIQLIEGLAVLSLLLRTVFAISCLVITSSHFWFFSLNIDELIILSGHVLFDEIWYSFT